MSAYYQLTVHVEQCVWRGSGEKWELKEGIPPIPVTLRAESYADAVERAEAYLPQLRPRLRYRMDVDAVTEIPDIQSK